MLLIQKKSRQAGFTLLEIAISLGIAGVLIVAIFATVSHVLFNVNLNAATDQLTLITGNLRSVYAGQSGAGGTMANQTYTNFTPIMIKSNVFPPEMLSPRPAPGQIPADGTVAYHNWDTSHANGSVQILFSGAASPATFTVTWYNLPTEVCTEMLLRNSLPGKDTGLTQITVTPVVSGGGPVVPTTYLDSANQLPTTAVSASIACSSSGVNQVDWVYKLRN